jgi:hypothetical protein
MNKSMLEALKLAYAKKGLQIPHNHAKVSGHGQNKDVRTTTAPVMKEKEVVKISQQVLPSKQAFSPSKRSNNTRSKQQPTQPMGVIRNELSQVYGGGKTPIQQSLNDSTNGIVPRAPWTIKIGDSARVHEFLKPNKKKRAMLVMHDSGIAEQPRGSNSDSVVHDIAIGLDFGTSCVKVIVGDRSLGRAFAVPFIDDIGIAGYLLPSHLWETNGRYSLESGEKIHRNLKLSLLASGDTSESQRRATAFLALILRHVRTWLFTQHNEIYNGTRIVWKLVLGMPAENYANNLLVGNFHVLAKSAWGLAGDHHKDIYVDLVDQIIAKVSELEKVGESQALSEEFDVVPELSAQIYGFLRSNQFDQNAENIFVMADVGAGTVDSALFQVKRNAGKWHFLFFTNHVQPYGVMNLHRTRIDWWSQALLAQPEPPMTLLEALQASDMPTDQLGGIPERLEDYVSDVDVSFSEKRNHPDEQFYKQNIVHQVQSNTIWRTWKDGFLDQNSLSGVPLFLCGGGSRMGYYRRLKEDLKKFPGCTWLSVNPRELEIPKDLVAPGLTKHEYDRLSVAYGLSFLEVGSIVKALPPPVAPSPQEPAWHFTDRFVDKDQV